MSWEDTIREAHTRVTDAVSHTPDSAPTVILSGRRRATTPFMPRAA